MQHLLCVCMRVEIPIFVFVSCSSRSESNVVVHPRERGTVDAEQWMRGGRTTIDKERRGG